MKIGAHKTYQLLSSLNGSLNHVFVYDPETKHVTHYEFSNNEEKEANENLSILNEAFTVRWLLQTSIAKTTSAKIQSHNSSARGQTLTDPVLHSVEVFVDPFKIVIHKISKVSDIKPPQTQDTKSFHKPITTNSKIECSVHGQNNKPIKVLIVDDSPTMRKFIVSCLQGIANVEIVAETGDPLKVEALVNSYSPDVMTLDINMPLMTGVDVLKRLLPKKFVPTIMISSLSLEEGSLVMDALDAGAVDYLQKPALDQKFEFQKLLADKIPVTAKVKAKPPRIKAGPLVLDDTVQFSGIIALGASTGGTQALTQVLTQLPANVPPILIVQHIPPVFSKAFADRLNQLCAFKVKEAEDGELIEPGTCYVAAGGFQMTVEMRSDRPKLSVKDGALMSGHKPSVDCLFESILRYRKPNRVAALLTGMGSDGAKGLLTLKEAGWHTIAEHESTCTVYGMPRVAVEMGAAIDILPLNNVATKIAEVLNVGTKKSLKQKAS
jgi:two-component system chemotaxis response regulator CheB